MGKLKRGQEVYVFNKIPKVKKSITLYRLVRDKLAVCRHDLCLMSY